MALDFYGEGYEAGQASASYARKAIIDAGAKGLAALCGKTIEDRKANPHADWKVKNCASWAVGFFDGYCQRAETMLEAGK